MSARIPIGEFSRATHLSVKTLRHYHDVGLLEPREVDPGSGYRYYGEDQIPVAQVIRRLRDLQMPVAEVRSMLAAPDVGERNQLIVAHLDRLEAELERTRGAVGDLRQLLAGPPPGAAIDHRTVAPIQAIVITDIVDRDDILAWWQGALGELQAILRAQRLTPAGASGGVYDSAIFQHGRGAATVYVPTAERGRAVGRVEPRTVPGAELAIAVHRGPLESVDRTYGELGAHVARHEISVDGPLREHYLVGFLDTPDEDRWETEIGWPIFRSGAGADAR